MGYADPNERFQEICDIYLETDGLMIKGKWDEAKYLLEKNLEQFPESRHLHKQLAQVLWYSYNDKNQSILERAIKEAERALNIGLSFGTVDYHLTGLLSRLLGESKDVKTLDRIFKRVFAIESSAVVYLDYAQALNQINEPRDRENKSSETLQVTTAISDAQAIKGLSYLIWGEARGESRGGMRAEGWVVRSRVLRGSVGSPACPYVVNTGSTLADQYKSVMCQSGQFYGMCLAWCSDPNTTKCTDNSTTFNVANDVYYGYIPDPVSPHCPGGITTWGGSYCADSTRCYGYTNTFRLAGPLFNYGTSGSCPSHSCAPNSAGKTCGNGGLDNCFYSNPKYCVGSNCVTYSGSLSGPGQCAVSASFSSSVTGYHKGHLEGPEGSYNLVDFDLYFQKWINNQWQVVAQSTRYGSVDDINYYGTSGSYRWRICAYTGSGSLKLYTSRP